MVSHSSFGKHNEPIVVWPRDTTTTTVTNKLYFLQAQYRRIVSCRCTADTPQIDYSRYNAGRGPQPSGVLAATHFRNPKDSHSQFRANTEVMTLRELSAPPLRGMDNQIVVERPMGGETEPFMR